MAGFLLCVSRFAHLNLLTNLTSRDYVNSHFTNNESEIQKGQVTCLKPHSVCYRQNPDRSCLVQEEGKSNQFVICPELSVSIAKACLEGKQLY